MRTPREALDKVAGMASELLALAVAEGDARELRRCVDFVLRVEATRLRYSNDAGARPTLTRDELEAAIVRAIRSADAREVRA